MLKKTRPSIWIPSIMVAWGITTTLMGLVHNYPGLLAARAALGIAEGGLFPGKSQRLAGYNRTIVDRPRCHLLHHSLV